MNNKWQCAGHQRQSLCCLETQNVPWRSATWRHWRTPNICSEKGRFIYLRLIAFCIWLRPHAVHVMHARFARDKVINSLRENNLPTPGYVLKIKHKWQFKVCEGSTYWFRCFNYLLQNSYLTAYINFIMVKSKISSSSLNSIPFWEVE